MNVGDVVYLKSGGQPMTVLRVFEDKGEDHAECGWFSDTKGKPGHTKTGYTKTVFPVHALADQQPPPSKMSAMA